jgi:hypothetical protein
MAYYKDLHDSSLFAMLLTRVVTRPVLNSEIGLRGTACGRVEGVPAEQANGIVADAVHHSGWRLIELVSALGRQMLSGFFGIVVANLVRARMLYTQLPFQCTGVHHRTLGARHHCPAITIEQSSCQAIHAFFQG